MKDFLQSFIALSECIHNYKKEIGSNEDRVNTLEELARNSRCFIPQQFFNAMRMVDVRYFVVQFDELMEHASKESGDSVESILERPDVVSFAKDIIYSLKTPPPLGLSINECCTDIVFDALKYCLLDINPRDNVCEIASNNGYLPALIGVDATSVTSFNLYSHIQGFPELSIIGAKYNGLGTITVVNDKTPYKKSLYSDKYSKSFSKIYSNVALNQGQYAQCKKLLKLNGRMVVPVLDSSNDIMLILHLDGEDIELFDFVEPISILPGRSNLN